jgi:hypothetical protein
MTATLLVRGISFWFIAVGFGRLDMPGNLIVVYLLFSGVDGQKMEESSLLNRLLNAA